MTKQDEFKKAIEENNLELVNSLLQEGRIDPEDNRNEALRIAAKYGYVDIVKLLFKVGVKAIYSDNCAIRIASFYGNITLVEFLLKEPKVDPTDCVNESLSYAYKNGYIEIVELLWNDQRIKNTLKNDNMELYNTLMQQDVKNKVSEF